jgi:hypothetical protein
MEEMVELVPGIGIGEQTTEMWELGCSWSVVIAGEVEKSEILKGNSRQLLFINENNSSFPSP